MSMPSARPFTGRHMTMIMVSFFAVVIGVNVIMAREAITTFGGVAVENSYVASQHFNRWLDEARAERDLGWKAEMSRRSDDRVELALSGMAAAPAAVFAVARHPLGRAPDVALRFLPGGGGRWLSVQPLPPGRWRLRIEVRGPAVEGKRIWRSEGDVR